MEKITEFLKKNWIWVLIAIVVLIVVSIYLKRNKKESSFNVPCADCGPGGMFGPAYAEAIEKAGGIDKWFIKRNDELIKIARELSGGISESDFELAIKRSGGLIPYIQGREISIKRIEKYTNDLKDVMNIPGVHGLGSIGEKQIEIAVKDEAAKQKAKDFVEAKSKANPVISCRPLPFHYAGYPVNIVIREQSKAQ